MEPSIISISSLIFTNLLFTQIYLWRNFGWYFTPFYNRKGNLQPKNSRNSQAQTEPDLACLYLINPSLLLSLKPHYHAIWGKKLMFDIRIDY